MGSQQFQHPIENLKPVATAADMEMLQSAVKEIFVDDLVKQYIAGVVTASRNNPAIYLGASPRGSLSLYRSPRHAP